MPDKKCSSTLQIRCNWKGSCGCIIWQICHIQMSLSRVCVCRNCLLLLKKSDRDHFEKRFASNHQWLKFTFRNWNGQQASAIQRQTGISVSYRKHRYQGLWYQYRSRLGHFLGLGISIGIGRATCTSFWVICNNSLLSKVSVSISVPAHFSGISVSIGLDWG